MDLDEFDRLLDAHGADLADWPPSLAGAARLLCDASPAARARREAALRRSAAFAGIRAAEPDPARIRAAVDGGLRRIRQRERAASSWSWLLSRPVGATFASMLVAGWLAGLHFVPPAADPANDTVAALAVLLESSGRDGEWLFR